MNSSGKSPPVAEERKPIIRWPSSPPWHAEAADVLGRCHGRLGQNGDTARDQVALLRFAGAQHTVDALADEIDEAVALAHEQFQIRIGAEKPEQGGHDEAPRLGALNIDAQQ